MSNSTVCECITGDVELTFSKGFMESGGEFFKHVRWPCNLDIINVFGGQELELACDCLVAHDELIIVR